MVILLVKGFCFILTLLAVALALGFGYLWANEYRPAPVEAALITGSAQKELSREDSLSILTLNMGYCGLSADMDCYFDGGELVRPPSSEIVERNLSGILTLLEEQPCDILFLQEIDRDSKRGYGIDSVSAVSKHFDGVKAFSNNFLCPYVPWPLPHTIGKVDSGMLTVSSFAFLNAERHALPTSFSWPVRICQLKRGLLVCRIPFNDSDKELVLINLHLEAYDSGEGKAAQTRVLADFMEEEYQKGNYCIAGGDFNQTFPSVDNSLYPALQTAHFTPGRLSADDFPGFLFAADGLTPTTRLNNQPYDPQSEHTQHYVIDGFILSPNVTLDFIHTIDAGFQYTDHNPVRLKVRFQ